MIEFGKTLKAAREAKGLSIADIAERTHIMSSVIADLEDENFTRLPAPIYGRGFVKLYCETVGIDPVPMTAEFMEIFNGNRESTIRERVVPPPPPATPEETPTVPAADEASSAPLADPIEDAVPPPNELFDLFSAPPSAPPPAPPPQETEPAKPQVPEPTPPPTREHAFAQYATPFRERAKEVKSYFPTAARLCVLALLLGLLVWGLVAGVRALYRATGNVGAEIPPTAEQPTADDGATAQPTAASTTDVKTSRTPLDIPPLYID